MIFSTLVSFGLIYSKVGLERDLNEEFIAIKMRLAEDFFDGGSKVYLIDLSLSAECIGAKGVCWDLDSPIVKDHAKIITAILNGSFYFRKKGIDRQELWVEY